MGFINFKNVTGEPVIETDMTSEELLRSPVLNKGTAFSTEERKMFCLEGMLPAHISSMEEQIRRVYQVYQSTHTDIEKYIYLRNLQDINETLFFALLEQHADEMSPIIYTPTVGEAVSKLSHIYQEGRGIWISPDNINIMDKILKSRDIPKVDIVVVTDNQGILGIGDQGAGGIGIAIGKLALYTVGAGVNPFYSLPISLDVGTNNSVLLGDSLYLGYMKNRLEGEEYNSLIEKFVDKLVEFAPNVLLQWEDFSKQNAFTNLEKFRNKILSFNDDIQGTGGVVAAYLKALHTIRKEKLADSKYIILGAGAGGIGVAREIRNSMMLESGLSKDEASSRIMILDSKGLVVDDRANKNDEYKFEFATKRDRIRNWEASNPDRITLAESIKNSKNNVLIGLSGQPGIFDAKIISLMLENTDSPIIMPLSNPTSKAEADPKLIIELSKGKASVATGSPFSPVEYNGKKYRIDQCNNVYIFPGVGLGAIAARAVSITDEMFTFATKGLADLMVASYKKDQMIIPNISNLKDVSFCVALSLYEKAVKEGLSRTDRSIAPEDAIRKIMWRPRYMKLERYL